MNTRWDRLARDLGAVDIPARVDARSFPGGVSYSILLRTDAGLVGVHDKWWRKNPEIWIGWQVHTEDREGIVTKTWPITKKRSQVVAAVKEATLMTIADNSGHGVSS